MSVGILVWFVVGPNSRISRLKSVAAPFPGPLTLACLGCAFVLLTTGLSNGQILQNGSFENDYTDWTASGHQAVATSDPSRPASSGSNVVVFNPNDMLANAVLSQTFATTPGQRYGLALDLGTVGAQADQRLGVTIAGNELLRDQILTVAGLDAEPFYVPQHITFVADSLSTTLTFQDASITYYVIDLLLDNIEITPEDAEAPLITSPPERFATATGEGATFSVAADGPGTLSYQWRFDGDPIGGATESSFTIAAVDASHAGNYDVVVSNEVGSVTSSGATLTVLPPGILLNGSFEHGSAAWTFTGVVATSTNINYGVTDGTQLTHFNFAQQPADGFLSQSFSTTPNQTYLLTFDAGAISHLNQDEQRMEVTVQGNNTLISPVVSVFAPGNGTTYVAQSFIFTADSGITTLTFHDISPTTDSVDLLLDNVQVTLQQNGAVITSQPQSLTVQEGGSASFSVTATGQAPLQYQWRFNETDIPGATSDTYTIDPVQNSDAGNYDVVVSDASASPPVTSATAVLTVVPPALQLTTAVSQKMHGGLGPFDVDLPLTDEPAVECRTGPVAGEHTLVLTFTNALNTVDSVSASATSPSGPQPVSSSGSIGADPHQYIVELSGVPNAQYVTVTLNDVQDEFGQVNAVVSLTMGVLRGDVDGSGIVTVGDTNATKKQALKLVTDANFRTDGNTSGRITTADTNLVKKNALSRLP